MLQSTAQYISYYKAPHATTLYSKVLHSTLSSPNIAPATQNESHNWSASHIKCHLQCADNKRHKTTSPYTAPAKWISQLIRHLQCAEQHWLLSNITKYCACHEVCKFKISAETPWIPSANRKTIRTDSEDNPSMKSSSRTRRFGDLTRPILETHFVWKNTTFRVPAISQNVTKCCAYHEKSHAKFTKYCACHEKCTLLFFSLSIYSL